MPHFPNSLGIRILFQEQDIDGTRVFQNTLQAVDSWGKNGP